MQKITALVLTALIAATASPAFAATSDLMSTYWFGH